MNKERFETNIYANQENRFFDFKQIWQYRDLVVLWIKKEFTADYKQSILGPAWSIIQPIISTLIYTIVFGGIARLSPNGIPMFLFFMTGQILWTFFSTTFFRIATTYLDNIYIISKVYFPRAILSIVAIISKFITFIIHFILFMIFYIVIYGNDFMNHIQKSVWLLPLLLIHLALLALAVGLILASLTSKYKDLYYLENYIVTLWMYLSPVVYDVSLVPEKFYSLYMLNPIAPIIMIMRNAFLNEPIGDLKYYFISILTTIVLLVVGINLFKKVEKTFIDTI